MAFLKYLELRGGGVSCKTAGRHGRKLGTVLAVQTGSRDVERNLFRGE